MLTVQLEPHLFLSQSLTCGFFYQSVKPLFLACVWTPLHARSSRQQEAEDHDNTAFIHLHHRTLRPSAPSSHAVPPGANWSSALMSYASPFTGYTPTPNMKHMLHSECFIRHDTTFTFTFNTISTCMANMLILALTLGSKSFPGYFQLLQNDRQVHFILLYINIYFLSLF